MGESAARDGTKDSTDAHRASLPSRAARYLSAGREPLCGSVISGLRRRRRSKRCAVLVSFDSRSRRRLKRWKAMSPQPTLGRRIPRTHTAHPYHPEQRDTSALVGNRCAGPKFRVCDAAGDQKGPPSLRPSTAEFGGHRKGVEHRVRSPRRDEGFHGRAQRIPTTQSSAIPQR